jgi:hypothetical protein
LSFIDHLAAAAAQGCQLATFTDTAERDLVYNLLVANPPNPASNNPQLGVAWVGLIGGPSAADYKWIDGCATFDTSFFSDGEPSDASETVGALIYDDTNVLAGISRFNTELLDIGITDGSGTFYTLPAVYECCVAPPLATKAPKSSSTKAPDRRERRRALR